MAITAGITTAGKKAFLDGVHLTGHTYKIALYTSSATLDPTSTTGYSATNEVAGTGYTAGGATLAGRASGSDSSGGYIDFTDITWATSTITARAAVIYNSSVGGNPAIAIIDFGADKSSSAGDFTIVFPTASGASAIIRIN